MSAAADSCCYSLNSFPFISLDLTGKLYLKKINKMRRSVTVSAIHRRGFASPCLHKPTTLSLPFSLLSSNSHTDDTPFSPKVAGIDSRVRGLGDMLRMPNAAVKIKHYSAALNLFDKMRAMAAPVNNCYCLLRRHESSLVGTSDTARAAAYPKPFCEWLAGIIDGDGSIQVNGEGYTSLEITMGLEDLRLLRYIQNMLGGGIKMRAGAKSYRYRLRDRNGMTKLINCINGRIRHSARLLQLHRACQVLEIPAVVPTPLDAESNWFAGFFDAEGSIDIAMNHGLPQLSIQVTNKLLQDVESYKAVFGGSVYFDSGRNGYYQWSINSRKDVILMLDYFKSNTFRSHQSRRFFLIKEYYSLYDLKAFEPESIHHKPWLAFLDKWNNRISE